MKLQMTIRRITIAAALVLAMGMTSAVFAVDEPGEVIVTEQTNTDEVAANTLDEPDELVNGFMMMQAQEELGEDTLDNENLRRNKLNKKSRKIYDRLHGQKVAIAEGDGSSTIIEVPIIDVMEKRWYTTDDLGLDELVTTEDGETYYITRDADAAMFKKIEEDVEYEKILHALLADTPYHLYWFDKTDGIEIERNFALDVDYDEDLDEVLISFRDDTKLICKFTVSTDYRGADEYTVDSESIGRTNQAALKATRIMTDGEGKSDQERLEYYKDVICEDVEYDYDAAEEDKNVPYGDPWQLIYAFDDDPKTKIVCEGYSKAFKFLCDLTEFKNSNLKCQLVTGNMYDGIGAGPHMWNIVHMNSNNDSNYLVDVTNCDGEDGYTSDYFLKGSADGTAEGYTVGGLEYEYDNKTIVMYDPEERTLAETDYEEELPKTRTSITKATVAGIANRTYNGANQLQHPIVKLDGKILTVNEDYEISYTNNINVGKATITIKGINAYEGEITGTFTINPKGTSVKSLKKAKKAFTVNWNRQSPQVSGYQIQYGLKSNFKGAKTITVNGATKASYKVKKLKKKKNYYVRVRTFTKTGGATYWSGWSGTRKVKTK